MHNKCTNAKRVRGIAARIFNQTVVDKRGVKAHVISLSNPVRKCETRRLNKQSKS